MFIQVLILSALFFSPAAQARILSGIADVVEDTTDAAARVATAPLRAIDDEYYYDNHNNVDYDNELVVEEE